jgi:hypothetical protein
MPASVTPRESSSRPTAAHDGQRHLTVVNGHPPIDLTQRGRQHVETLVAHQAAGMTNNSVCADPCGAPQALGIGRPASDSAASTSIPVRDRRICRGSVQMPLVTVASSDRSVAMMQSAARAHADRRPQRRVAEPFHRGHRSAVAPNSSRPCGFSTSGCRSHVCRA